MQGRGALRIQLLDRKGNIDLDEASLFSPTYQQSITDSEASVIGRISFCLQC
jgi:hypothetical protein